MLTLFLMSFLDTLGTLVGVGAAGGMLDERGNFPRVEKPMMVDAATGLRRKILIFTEPKDTLDVISIGASTSLATLMPLTLWQTCGMTSYSLATPYQSAQASYYLLLDALRNQSPKVVILNSSFLFTSSNSSAKHVVFDVELQT